VNVKRRTVIGVSAAVVVVGGALWAALRPHPVSVEVQTVTPGPLRVTVDEDGRVRVRERYLLSSPLSGTLLRPSVRAGDPCTPGKTLARIVPVAPPLLDARTRSEVQARARAADDAAQRAEAALALARNELDQAERNLVRARQLAAAGSISQEARERIETDRAARARDVEVAERGRDVARHERDAARAALLRTQDRPGQPEDTWEVTCPVQGVILRVLQESEAVVQPGTGLFELGDLDTMEAVADVLTTEAVPIRPGAEVIIDRWGGQGTLQARVRRVEPSAFTKVSALGVEEQRVNVVADLVDPPERRPGLGDGFRVEVHVVTADLPRALLVPLGALFRQGERWTVFRVEDGRATLRPVTLGLRNTRVAEVREGLSEGDTVVLYPGEALEDGTRVALRLRR
jgi:HlyD family secretion protein